MIISMRSMSYEDLKKQLTKDDKIVLWSCDTCVKHTGIGGYDKLTILENMLKKDGFNILTKELIGVSCVPDLIMDRKINITKKDIFEEATVIIPLTCEAGWDELNEVFPEKKIIKVLNTVGVGICSEKRGTLLTNPFEDLDLEPDPKGITLRKVAEKLNLFDTFFNEDKEVLPVKELVEITINGQKVKVNKGETLLKSCLDNGFKVPHLCYTDILGGASACRLCVVKIKDMRGLVASCSIDVADGMEITTEDDELTEYRRMNLELILASQKHDCLFCTHNNKCELQDLIHELGVENKQLRQEETLKPIDDSSMAFTYDSNKCILCGRCIRACDEVAGKHNLAFLYRGNDTIVASGMNENIGESDCATCLACVLACPTGALSERMRKFDGKDWKPSKLYGYYQ